MDQKVFSSLVKGSAQKILGRGRDTHLHSKEHLLADDLSKMMGEEKRFAAYLGIAKLHYESDLRALARYVLEKENLPVEARGKYFFAALKGLPKRPGVKFKKKKPKKKKKRNGKNTSNRPGAGKSASEARG